MAPVPNDDLRRARHHRCDGLSSRHRRQDPCQWHQPTLAADVEAYFEDAPATELVTKTTVEKGHGRSFVSLGPALPYALRLPKRNGPLNTPAKCMSDRIPNVRARSPLRLGLAGGGTDLSPYCDEHGGAVLNATIDRFAYAHVSHNNDGKLILRARDVGEEEVLKPDAGLPIRQGLMLHRAVYARVMKDHCGGVGIPLTLSTTIDVPAGSGLGASSALVVALLEAFRSALQLPLGQYDVARLAFEVERVDLGLAGGRQDQYAAAFGGLNYIEFLHEERVIVNPLRIRRDYLNEFEFLL